MDPPNNLLVSPLEMGSYGGVHFVDPLGGSGN